MNIRSMQRGLLLLVLTGSGAVWAQGSEPAPSEPAPAAAIVHGEAGEVSAEDVVLMAREQVPPQARAMFWGTPDSIGRFARGLYARKALATQALDEGLDQTEEAQRYLRLNREVALAELLLRQRALAAAPDDAALDAYARSEYAADPKRFTLPERVHARHILLKIAPDGSDEAAVEDQALRLLEQLRGGADFAELAREHSDDTGSAEEGGDLGFFSRGQMVPSFDKAAFELTEPGELVGPVKSRFGYHIIELVERKDDELQPFEEVLPELRQEAAEKLGGRTRQSLWQEAEAQGELDDDALKALSAAQVKQLDR